MYDVMYVIMYDITYDLMLWLINFSLLLSKTMVTWIFGHYHIVHEIICDLCDLVTEDIDHKFFVNS